MDTTSITAPDYLCRLLALNRKKEVERYVKGITVGRRDIALLIYTCEQLGYLHYAHYSENQPNHLQLNESELSSLQKGEPTELRKKERAKAISKISNMLTERKVAAAHIFVRGSEWHMFFLSNFDTLEEKNQHWKCGPHMHYVNYLWPEHTPETIFANLPQRPNGVHIKYDDKIDHGG